MYVTTRGTVFSEHLQHLWAPGPPIIFCRKFLNLSKFCLQTKNSTSSTSSVTMITIMI